jgi:hypothetical protein
MSVSRTIAATATGLALLIAAATEPPVAPKPADRKPPIAEQPEPPPGMPLRAGSYPRSFLIPGTDTSISIGGH